MSSPAALQTLQQRINAMQPQRLDARTLPTASGLVPLLPGGALRAGAMYSVRGSWQLALMFLTEASQRGSWCGVLGCPSFGAEAAAELGVALDRCVLIPNPGEHALSIAGSLSDTFEVIVARFDAHVSPANIERLSARLREHGTALVVMGDWARGESRLTVLNSRWSGLGRGSGLLKGRELTVQTEDRRGAQTHTLRWGPTPFGAKPEGMPQPPSLRAV